MANNRCGNCKFLGAQTYQCEDDCVFAQCFPPEKLKVFEQLHKIFGADSIYKILSDDKLLPSQREEAVRSLVYAAEARIRDPIYGVFGMISVYQKELETLDKEIRNAMSELSSIGMVPPYYGLPIPDFGCCTPSSMKSIIEGLNDVQKKQIMQRPPSDAQKIMNEMFGHEHISDRNAAFVAVIKAALIVKLPATPCSGSSLKRRDVRLHLENKQTSANWILDEE